MGAQPFLVPPSTLSPHCTLLLCHNHEFYYCSILFFLRVLKARVLVPNISNMYGVCMNSMVVDKCEALISLKP